MTIEVATARINALADSSSADAQARPTHSRRIEVSLQS
jgi:hypothetical protein